MDLVGSYRCDCKPGYTGNNCQTGNKRPPFVGGELFPHPLPFFFFRKLQDEKTDTCPILQKLMSALHVQARTERHVGILSKVTAVIAP